ncbi:MAG: glycosyltransferase family 1 protein [Chitinophagaceae bacterium]|nr:MAG: glycosyltransferase family 1 protein [Chitinophagaceae bacterium]
MTETATYSKVDAGATGKKKIRVLECIRQGQIGGGESHLLSLVENLDRSSYDPVVLSFTDGPMIERLTALGIENKVIHTTRPFDIGKWKAVKAFIKSQSVDLVHAHGTRANSNVLWAARSLGIPVIYTVHGWSFHQDQQALVRRIRILGEKYLVSKSDLTISVSASNQESGRLVIPSLRSVVVNNGIDQLKFNPGRRFTDVRRQLGIPAAATLVLFIARFTSHKQPLTLIDAFAKALGQRPELHLLMVGDGDQKAEAIEKIKAAGLQDKITLETFRQDVPDVLAAADIFVLPSLWEGLPIGLLEAMSMGRAVIATNVDGSREVIRNRVNGLLTDTNQLVPNLTSAIVELAGNPLLRHELASYAMATVNEKYNAANMTREIESLYRQVLDKTNR